MRIRQYQPIAREANKERFEAPIIAKLAMLDTATEQGHDKDALACAEIDQLGRWFIRWGWTGDWTQNRRIKELEKVDDWFNPRKIGIEIAAQTSMAYILGQDYVEGNSNVAVKLYAVKPHGVDPEVRVAAIEPLLRRGLMFFHQGIPPHLIEQIQYFPEKEFDDFAVAVAYLIQMAHELHIRPGRKRGQSYLGDDTLSRYEREYL